MTHFANRLGCACAGVLLASSAHAQVSGFLSVEKSFTATAGPHAGTEISGGDIISTRGGVIQTNRSLIDRFCKKPVVRDVGLDALAVLPGGRMLFSFEESFFSECIGETISHGDLLAPEGTVYRTNFQLMENFHPQPPIGDVGLDGVFVLSSGEILFSTENDVFDEQLGVVLSQGDILSSEGRVVRTNAELMMNFHPQPPIGNQGLDVIVALPSGEYWWSPERGWFDEQLGVMIGGGDLLSETGRVVATEAQLLAAFFSSEPAPGIGLDAFAFPAEFASCGLLKPGPQSCLVFLPEDSKQAYFVENLKGHVAGDEVFIAGQLNPASSVCSPVSGLGIENNTIGECFEGCGVLVQGVECVLFEPYRGGQYRLSDLGRFQVGDEVLVRGQLIEICFSTCQQGGCIDHNTIMSCCPCDWNGNDAVNSQDFFDFLEDFFGGEADFNGDDLTNSQDFFDFLKCFFAGCA